MLSTLIVSWSVDTDYLNTVNIKKKIPIFYRKIDSYIKITIFFFKSENYVLNV